MSSVVFLPFIPPHLSVSSSAFFFSSRTGMQKRVVSGKGGELSEYKKGGGKWELSPYRKSGEWRQMLSDTY